MLLMIRVTVITTWHRLVFKPKKSSSQLQVQAFVRVSRNPGLSLPVSLNVPTRVDMLIAKFADAVSLVRGDRFLTVELTRTSFSPLHD
jgi:hypothetical protein